MKSLLIAGAALLSVFGATSAAAEDRWLIVDATQADFFAINVGTYVPTDNLRGINVLHGFIERQGGVDYTISTIGFNCDEATFYTQYNWTYVIGQEQPIKRDDTRSEWEALDFDEGGAVTDVALYLCADGSSSVGQPFNKESLVTFMRAFTLPMQY